MSEQYHRDDLIRKKLQNFEKAPPPEIWDGIRNAILSRKRRIIPFYLRYAAGIALLVGLVTLIRFFIPHMSSPENILSLEQERSTSTIKAEPITPVQTPGNAANEPSSLQENANSLNLLSQNKKTPVDKRKILKENDAANLPRIPGNQKLAEQKNQEKSTLDFSANHPKDYSIPRQIPPGDPSTIIIAQSVPKNAYSWSDLIPAGMEETEQTKDKIFSLGVQVSPIYSYRDLAGINASLNEYFNDSESGKISYSGGISLGINAGTRISIQSGILYSRLGVSVNNILAVADLKELYSDEIRFEPDATSAYLVSNSIGSIESGGTQAKAHIDYSSLNPATPSATMSSELNYLNSGGFYNPADNYVPDGGTIDQFFSYLEIPLILRYKIIDRKVDFGLLGGLSTNFLVGNSVVYRQDGKSEVIGETSQIQSINYSGNIGIGLNYDISGQFRFLVEPQVKYYLNSINRDQLIINRPYSVGFYTGFVYLF